VAVTGTVNLIYNYINTDVSGAKNITVNTPDLADFQEALELYLPVQKGEDAKILYHPDV
jgi:hypothetical protein